MTHWYDDPQWDEWFTEVDVYAIERNNNTQTYLPPLKYFDDCPDLRHFRAAWLAWGIPARTRREWRTMIRKAFHTPPIDEQEA